MSVPTLSIRPARQTDASEAAPLIRLSMGDEIDWLFGQAAGHPTDEVVKALFRRRNNRVSHAVCCLAEWAGQVVGLLLAYPGHILHSLDLRTGWHLLGIFGWRATLRLARQQAAYGDLVEAQADEFYISNLAVAPQVQSRGIGAHLLAHADALARSSGFSKCSLIVTYDNPARRLYARDGYEVVQSFPIDHPVIAHGSGGFHRMVKDLTAHVHGLPT